jgi:FkbH-like protein
MTVTCDFGGFSSAAEEIEALAGYSTQGPETTLTVLALGLEMTARDFGRTSWAAEAACQRHLMLVRAAVERSATPLAINSVLPPLFSSTGLALKPGTRTHGELVDELNKELRLLAGQQPGRVVLIDWTAIARELGEKGTYDYRFWYSSGAPFASTFLARYAAGIASTVRALTGKARKCLVLDCDNTIWGGVIGEDGRDGIKLAADTVPGAYFQAFQRSVLDLHSCGVAIALCSKNDEADVFDVLDNHPDCVIRREHLAAWRINWNEKAQSIGEIASELNIGRDALVFVDDSASECQMVMSILPEVLVVQTPSNHEDLVNFLDRRQLFDALVVTDEDVRRTRSYRDNHAREVLSGSIGDLSDYKRQLLTQLTVRRATPADVPRISQLVQRTNQFNLTTRRHGQGAIERMVDDPDVMILCADLRDRFGDLGLIGVAIANRAEDGAEIDSMLMSCRALGRDAELAFIAALFGGIHRQWGHGRLMAQYLASAKNALVADFWQRVGLVRDDRRTDAAGGVHYVSELDLKTLATRNLPAHVALTDLIDGQ